MNLFKQEQVKVSDDGELVSIEIGSDGLRMHYEDALKISQLIRVHAKRAKRKSGDMSRHWSVVATIDGITE